MRKLRWQLIVIFFAGLVVGIILLSDTTTSPMQIFDTQPTQGGIYREGLIGNIQRLNPLLSYYNNADMDVCALVYSGLVKFDSRGMAIPDLAAGWGISLDGTVYNFAINPAAKWHDGQPVTADDVIFTYEMLKQATGYAPDHLISFWNKIQINAVGTQSVQFVLSEPFSPFLDYLSMGILPKHIWGNLNFESLVDSKINLQPIGSGPFKMKELLTDKGKIKGVTLENNNLYYGDRAFLEQIQFTCYADSVLAFQAYQQGMIDGISAVSSEVLKTVLSEPELSLYSARLPIETMILLNLDRKEVAFFQDIQVRKALVTGLNRQKMVAEILNGQGIIAHGPILVGNWAFYDGIAQYAYDPNKAIEILKSAGYILANEQDHVRSKDNVLLNFTMLYADDDQHRMVAERIQQDWAKVNVLVNLEAVSYDDLIQNRLENRDYDAALVDINMSNSPDPDPYPFWDQTQITSGQNYAQWNNRVVSQYLETARVILDQSERERLYRNFQIVFAEEIPALPLYTPIYNYPVSTKVKGVSIGPLYRPSDRFLNVDSWYVISRSTLNNELKESETKK